MHTPSMKVLPIFHLYSISSSVAWVFKFDIFKFSVCVCVYLPVYCIIFVSFNHVKHCKKEIKRMEIVLIIFCKNSICYFTLKHNAMFNAIQNTC